MTGLTRLTAVVAFVTTVLLTAGSAGATLWPTQSARAVAHSSTPGIYLGDDTGEALPGPARVIAERLLAAARAHSVTAYDALLSDFTGSALASQNKSLTEPGVFEQIVKILTETHGAPTDGETYPGFIMARGEGMFDAHDERVMGVTSYAQYRGVRIFIGESAPSGIWGFAGIQGPTAAPIANAPRPADVVWEYAFGNRSTVEFGQFIFTGDATGELKGMHWSSWTTSSAHGTGLFGVNDCKPDCAAGVFKFLRARVILSDPLHLSCGTIYTTAVFYQTSSTALNSPIVSNTPIGRYVTSRENLSQLCSP
jgi:hypothetical protein